MNVRNKKMFTLTGGKYWVKKINGKIHHFGTDDDQAVKKYLREKPYLEAGIPVPDDGADKVAPPGEETANNRSAPHHGQGDCPETLKPMDLQAEAAA